MQTKIPLNKNFFYFFYFLPTANFKVPEYLSDLKKNPTAKKIPCGLPKDVYRKVFCVGADRCEA
jgi:hypothetical protein